MHHVEHQSSNAAAALGEALTTSMMSCCVLHLRLCRFKTLLRFSWHAVLVNIVSCLVLALTAQRAETAATTAALLKVPISAMQQQQPAPFASAGAAAMPSALVAAPGNFSAVLLNESMAGGATAAAAIAPASYAAAGSSAAVTGLLASLPAWLLPMAWLVVTHLAVARNSKRLEQLSTKTVPLAMLLPVSLLKSTASCNLCATGSM
jgi:hypothetical protein